jgi:hypothetical protein
MMDPAALDANPENWRTHPKRQLRALTGILDEVGWVTRVIFNRRTNRMVDGHARVKLALAKGEKEIPVDVVDLSESEERLVLLTLDPSGALAGQNEDHLEDADDEETDGSVGAELDTSFKLVVTVDNEEQQLELIEWVQAKGYKCRALI